MKNKFSTLVKMTTLAVGVLSLGSCSRSEYAMLPKGASYAGSTRIATPVPVAPAPTAMATPAPVPATKEVVAAPSTPEVAPKAAVAAAAVATPAEKPAASAAAPKTLGSAAVATTAPHKLNLVQRMVLSKAVSKLNKLAQKSGSMSKHENTAATTALDSRLKQAILFAAIGLLVEIVGIAIGSTIIYIIGGVLVVVGAVFFIIWLVEQFSK